VRWDGTLDDLPVGIDGAIARGFATVAIDREADEGRYCEPNVWMRHTA